MKGNIISSLTLCISNLFLQVCTTPVKVASIHSINSTLPLLSKQEVNEMSTLGPQCLSTVRESSHACNCSGNKISNADGENDIHCI